MRVILDLDGVCYKWSDTARFLLEHEFGVELGESTYWNYIKDNIEPHQWDWLWTEGIERGLYRYGHLYKGTKEAVDYLTHRHEVVLVTSRPRHAVADTMDWLSYHRFNTQEVHIVGQDKPKSSVPGDVYVDDSLTVLEDVMENTGDDFILVDRPWNRRSDDQPVLFTPEDRARRAYGWGGIIEALEEVA